ncbi:MAG: type II toxin-antitoxin system VapC family toxin [Acidobacteriaceae bacterium]|nr:type II toxin-antitoxin system VapC family toxin [Acidobacteriaceae bacterium]
MALLLDTNAFIRLLGGKLPLKVERKVQKSTELILSVASVWEITMKQELSKRFTASILAEKIVESGVRVLPITLAHTMALYNLPGHHADPFDRIIIAQALLEGCPVVSSDQRFPAYRTIGLHTIWD